MGKAVAIASLAKPYSGAEMLEAVDDLFRHLLDDESRPARARVEMFDPGPQIAQRLRLDRTFDEHHALSTPRSRE